MKKVLFITHNCNFATNFLIPQINLYKKLGFFVGFASSFDLGEPPSEVDQFYDIDIKQSPLKLRQNFKAFIKLKKIVEFEHYDVINCHTPMGGVLGRMLKISYPYLEIIYTAHGFHFYKGAPLLNWLLFYPVEKYLSKYTDKQIVINKEDFNNLNKKHFKSRKKYLVNGVGVMIDSDNVFKQELKEKLKDYYPVIISVGQLNKNKNQRLLINAFDDIKVEYPKAKLLILGEGPLRKELEGLIHQLSLTDSIELVGYSLHAVDYISNADILVSTSYREGLPKNVMEALAQGIPCLVSHRRGNTDLIQSGYNGVVFDKNSKDSLLNGFHEILNNYDFLKSNTLASIEPYLLDNVLSSYKQIFVEKL